MVSQVDRTGHARVNRVDRTGHARVNLDVNALFDAAYGARAHRIGALTDDFGAQVITLTAQVMRK
ncbi:hypothetical protein [Ornithinimicrobium sp. Y1694]|uniref:hypothetical protein n=1 Tax=Ornithinimicrobium sp. Y1694 TaxID=3418590 RepID=UPI003CEE1916